MMLKMKQWAMFKISLLLLQSLLCVFIFPGNVFAIASDNQETNLSASSTAQDGQLLFASGPSVPVAASIARSNHFSGHGFYNKDALYPGYSLTHSERSFLNAFSKKSFTIPKQDMRLHLACCVLRI